MAGALDSQVALITGCGRLKGLGRGIALGLAREGADVVVTDLLSEGTRNPAEAGEAEAAVGWRGLDSLVEEIEAIGVRARAIVGDVADPDSVEQTFRDAIDHFGRVDILVNNAAAPHGDDRRVTWEVPEAAWDIVLRVNLKGTFLMSSAMARHLLERKAPGRIINISSNAAKRGTARHAAYCASKFAITALTQSMAHELAEHRVTVNSICAGGNLDTARADSRRGRLAAGTAVAEDVEHGTTPVGRDGTPQDIAHAVVFLANPASDFITGDAINVNGGTLIS